MDFYTEDKLVKLLGNPIGEFGTRKLSPMETSLGYEFIEWLLFNPPSENLSDI